jgi:hypothetical protein
MFASARLECTLVISRIGSCGSLCGRPERRSTFCAAPRHVELDRETYDVAVDEDDPELIHAPELLNPTMQVLWMEAVVAESAATGRWRRCAAGTRKSESGAARETMSAYGPHESSPQRLQLQARRQTHDR